jgi:hypothetical protein
MPYLCTAELQIKGPVFHWIKDIESTTQGINVVWNMLWHSCAYSSTLTYSDTNADINNDANTDTNTDNNTDTDTEWTNRTSLISIPQK